MDKFKCEHLKVETMPWGEGSITSTNCALGDNFLDECIHCDNMDVECPLICMKPTIYRANIEAGVLPDDLTSFLIKRNGARFYPPMEDLIKKRRNVWEKLEPSILQEDA